MRKPAVAVVQRLTAKDKKQEMMKVWDHPIVSIIVWYVNICSTWKMLQYIYIYIYYIYMHIQHEFVDPISHEKLRQRLFRGSTTLSWIFRAQGHRWGVHGGSPLSSPPKGCWGAAKPCWESGKIRAADCWYHQESGTSASSCSWM